jgi:tetratricopeptide (TPR) repeat protein
MRKILVCVLTLVTLGVMPVRAAQIGLDDPTLPGAGRYDRCLALIRKNAERANELALEWRNASGGAPAVHCSALALVAMKHYGEAALKLDQLGNAITTGNGAARALLLGQAGNAWLLASQPANALASFSAALALAPGDPDTLTDRARAKAMQKDWAGAEADLTLALQRSPANAEIYVLRSSARHAQGRKGEAMADVEQALRIRPNYPEALVERGAMKLENGDKVGARTDWQSVLTLAPEGDAADSARQHIQQLDSNAPTDAK